MVASARQSRFEAFSRLARIGGARGNDVNAFLDEACALAVEALGLDRTVIYRLLPGGEIVPIVASGAAPPLEHVGGLVSRLEDRPLFRRALETRDVVVVSGTGEDPIQPKEADGAGARTVVVAPLFGSELCLGFLAGEDGELDADRVRAYADVAGAFLEQALERERLSRLGDLKSHFIALASHELRAPVAVIHGIGITLNARREALDLDEVTRLHGILNDQTGRLATLVNQLLDLSRLEANAIKLERQAVPVRTRVETIVRTVVAEDAPYVEVDVPDDLETLVDPAAFDRIVSNLVANAVTYGAPPVRISAMQLDTHFRLAVEDRGEGVSREFVPRLFERFARDSGGEGGSGLGLAIAQSYAHAHGGELIYGDADPRGARFELVLPAPHLTESS